MCYAHANHTHYIRTDSLFLAVGTLRTIVLLVPPSRDFVFSGVESFYEISPLLCLFVYRCVSAAQNLPSVGHTAAG